MGFELSPLNEKGYKVNPCLHMDEWKLSPQGRGDMVPIHAIFNDIRRRRNTDDVRLPAPSEIAAFSDEESDSVRSESPIRR